jgi:hypothetical protein
MAETGFWNADESEGMCLLLVFDSQFFPFFFCVFILGIGSPFLFSVMPFAAFH